METARELERELLRKECYVKEHDDSSGREENIGKVRWKSIFDDAQKDIAKVDDNPVQPDGVCTEIQILTCKIYIYFSALILPVEIMLR